VGIPLKEYQKSLLQEAFTYQTMS